MKTNFKNKSILLAITSDRGFYSCFNDNLKHLGFTVYLLRELPFKYDNIKDRLFNTFHKIIFRNNKYKQKLISQFPENIKHQTEVLNTIKEPVDYSLTIRVDIFKINIVKQIIKKSNNAYAYQWDGINRFPEVKTLIPLFKKFYVFDKEDINIEKNTSLLTNFYFDCYSEIFKNTKPKFDIYYIGSYDNRINQLINIGTQLHQLGLKINIIIICNKRRQKKLRKYPFFNLPKEPLTYLENLTQVANSKAILEIGHTNLHSGLSFRAFEALGYNKKLITNNTAISDYDFYNPNNFHVYKNNNELLDFLETPSILIDNSIKEKYSFSNWIKRVLEY